MLEDTQVERPELRKKMFDIANDRYLCSQAGVIDYNRLPDEDWERIRVYARVLLERETLNV